MCGDIPSRVIKECAQFLCIPVKKIINQSIIKGKWASIYKKETITPIPKRYPPETIDQLRPIANLMNLNKIQERAIADMVISDMERNLDPSQYGNRKNTSIQHYLVKLIHRILAAVDKNSKKEINAVLCSFVDWRQAYSRQSPAWDQVISEEWGKASVNPSPGRLFQGAPDDSEMERGKIKA